MTCRRCKTAEATGVMFCLCAPCFEAWADHTQANLDAGGMYHLSDEEFEYLNEGTWPLPDGRVVVVGRPN